jgi:hypothetical protein
LTSGFYSDLLSDLFHGFPRASHAANYEIKEILGDMGISLGMRIEQ